MTADAVVLWGARPHVALLWRSTEHPAAALATMGADRLVAVFATAAVWTAAAWVAFALVCVAAASLPGVVGRLGDALAGVLVPAAVRRVLAVSLGVGLVAAPAYGAVAHPAGGARPTAGVVAGVSWAGRSPAPGWPTAPGASGSSGTAPAAPLPMTPPATGPSHGGPSHGGRPDGGRPATDPRPARGADGDVRVRTGDSLWLIAAHRLGGDAMSSRVATYWPRVYAANRARIGDDPGLLVPGQVLHLPDPADAGST